MRSMKFRTPSRAASLLTVGLILLVATTMFAQQLSEPSSEEETTAKLVTRMIERFHINQPEIGDEVSQKLLKRYLRVLDPQKLYFLKQDVDGFRRYRTQLDDLLESGNVQFAMTVYDRYLERLDERIKLAHQLIDRDFDFEKDEELVTDPEEISWAQSEEEIEERWRKRIKNDVLTLMLDGRPLKEIRERLHKRYRNLSRSKRQAKSGEVLEKYLSALAHCLDPHSSYMSPQTLEEFRISMQLSLEGIGAELRSEDGYTIVNDIVPGGAADQDGRLQVGDKIIGVGQGKEGELVDIVEMKLNRVVQLIRGPKDSVVRLQVKKAKTGEVKEYALTRQKVEIQSAAVKGRIIDTAERLGEQSARIGVIRIPSFYRDFQSAQQGKKNFRSAVRDVRKVLQNFKSQGGVDAVVVDLRFNGGGALNEAIAVSGLFIDKGPVVMVKEQDGNIDVLRDEDPGAAYDGPLVVVCNRLSASASEIFAAAIKDYRRGIVVGDERTHGKGTVQHVMPVSQEFLQFLNREDRGALKLTINQFYRVNGDSTQVRGVQSDIVLPSPMALGHIEGIGEADMDNALPFSQIPAADYETAGLVTPDIISALQQASQQRVAASEEFQKDIEEIEEFVERQKRTTKSLNLKVRRRRQEEKEDSDVGDARGINQPEGNDDDDSSEDEQESAFPDNHYNNEVLRITLDYLNLLNGMKTARK